MPHRSLRASISRLTGGIWRIDVAMVTPERQDWIDRAKGILIFLVVLGHVVGAAGNLASGVVAGELLSVRNEIYLFHMPAFFLLAGMIWRRNESGFPCFARKKAVRLLIPYFVFGLFSCGVFAVVTGYETWWQPFVSLLHAGGWPGGLGFRCNSVLWFLPVMFVSLACWYGVDRVAGTGRTRRLVLVALSLLLWSLRLAAYRYRLWFWPWGVISVVWFLPFVMIGNAILDIPLLASGRKTCALLLMFVSAFVFVDLVRIVFRCNLMQWSGIACHAACGLLGALACFALSQDVFYMCLPRLSSVLVQLGDMSMGVMLFHKFFVVALQEHIGCIRHMFVGGLLPAVIGCVFVTAASVVASVLATMLIRKYVPELKI